MRNEQTHSKRCVDRQRIRISVCECRTGFYSGWQAANLTLPEGVHGRYFINPVARTLITRILFMKCCALYTEILRRQGPYIKSWMPSSYADDMCQLTCGWLPYCLQIKRHYGRFQEGATRAFFVTRFETATWKLSNVQVLRISMKDADALSKNCHS
jgi:hypothetical protein